MLCEWPELTTPGTGVVRKCLRTPVSGVASMGIQRPVYFVLPGYQLIRAMAGNAAEDGNTMSHLLGCWYDITRHARKQYR